MIWKNGNKYMQYYPGKSAKVLKKESNEKTAAVLLAGANMIINNSKDSKRNEATGSFQNSVKYSRD
jgi:hypothetical protein